MDNPIRTGDELKKTIDRNILQTRVVDFHTKLLPSEFGSLFKAGIDSLLSDLVLVQEFHIGERTIKPEQFASLAVPMQADLVWTKLFIEHSPLSEAQSGIVYLLHQLGINSASRDIEKIRKQLALLDKNVLLDKVFELAKLDSVVMSNDPYNPEERTFWKQGVSVDERFKSSISLDSLFYRAKRVCGAVRDDGLSISDDMIPLKSVDAKILQQHLKQWIGITQPVYFSLSVWSGFSSQTKSQESQLLDEVVLPILLEERIPLLLLMNGDRDLKTEISSLVKKNPNIDFFLSSSEGNPWMLDLVRHHPNAHAVGLHGSHSTQSQLDECIDSRMELLGTGFIPQFSNASVLEQLVYKWKGIRTSVGKALYKRYAQIVPVGWEVTENDIRNDIQTLFNLNAEKLFKRYS